jgi:hypothetical protein
MTVSVRGARPGDGSGFYEQHMGYTRRSIIFQKRLRSSDPQRPQNRHHPAANGGGDRDQDT